jgi:hypothetical protein
MRRISKDQKNQIDKEKYKYFAKKVGIGEEELINEKHLKKILKEEFENEVFVSNPNDLLNAQWEALKQKIKDFN